MQISGLSQPEKLLSTVKPRCKEVLGITNDIFCPSKLKNLMIMFDIETSSNSFKFNFWSKSQIIKMVSLWSTFLWSAFYLSIYTFIYFYLCKFSTFKFYYVISCSYISSENKVHLWHFSFLWLKVKQCPRRTLTKRTVLKIIIYTNENITLRIFSCRKNAELTSYSGRKIHFSKWIISVFVVRTFRIWGSCYRHCLNSKIGQNYKTAQTRDNMSPGAIWNFIFMKSSFCSK